MLYTKLLASTTLTAATGATPLVGAWVDVDMYRELVAWLNVTEFAARDDETLDVTIERWADNTAGHTTVATFTQKTAAGSEEKTVTSLFGGRIRYRVVAAGTFASGTSVTFNIGMQAK